MCNVDHKNKTDSLDGVHNLESVFFPNHLQRNTNLLSHVDMMLMSAGLLSTCHNDKMTDGHTDRHISEIDDL